MPRLIHRKVKVVQLVHPGTQTTSTDAQNAAVDTKGFSEALILVNIGTCSASTTLTVDIQHSDEAAANFATISTPVINTINPKTLALTNADANTPIVGYFDLKSLKRYIKPVETLNANSQAYGMSVILFGPMDSEQTNNTNQPYEPSA